MDSFAFLANDLFPGVAHSFSLVRFRWIIGADIRGNLTDEMFIDALDLNPGIFNHGNLDPRRNRKKNVVRKAQIQKRDANP